MTLSTFPTFLAFLTRKLRWIQANQKTLGEIRREAVGRAIHRWQVNPLLFPGHQCQKGQKGQKGGRCHDAGHLSDLPVLSGAEAMSSGSWQRPLAGVEGFFLPSPRARPVLAEGI
jgi:hypothetical protein